MSDTGFFHPGSCADPFYANVRDGAQTPLIEGRTFTESLWKRYADVADQHFRQDARAHFVERFWEMYLAVAFQDRHLNVLPGSGTGPDFRFVLGASTIWVEAVA